MSPYFLQQGHILLLLTRYPRLPYSTSLPIDHILMLWPFLTITCLLACCSPFLSMLPLGNEDDTPDHDDEGIDEVSWTVLCCIMEDVVANRCQDAYQSREYQPFLQESNECEVSLWICTQILLQIAQHYPPIFWIFMYRYQLLKPSMFHNIS